MPYEVVPDCVIVGVSPVYAANVIILPLVPLFAGWMPPSQLPARYVPPLRYTTSPAAALEFAVGSEQAAVPDNGVLPTQLAQAAVPVGLTQYVPARAEADSMKQVQRTSIVRMHVEGTLVDIAISRTVSVCWR
jgi:hypothetical protein